MAPKLAIGWPNCRRSRRTSPTSPMAALHPPVHIAPSLKRPKLSMLNAILWPLPISPSRFSAGTGASCRMTGVVDEPCRPILCSSLPLLTPRKRALDDEGGEVLAVHLGEDDEDVGEAAVGDPHLLAVQRRSCRRAGASPAPWRPARPSPIPTRSARRRRPARPTTQLRQVLAASASSVPNRGSAGCTGSACAPKVAPNDADRAIVLGDDQRRRPCRARRRRSASGTSTPSRPSSPQRRSSVARQRPSPSAPGARAPAAPRSRRTPRPSARSADARR